MTEELSEQNQKLRSILLNSRGYLGFQKYITKDELVELLTPSTPQPTIDDLFSQFQLETSEFMDFHGLLLLLKINIKVSYDQPEEQKLEKKVKALKQRAGKKDKSEKQQLQQQQQVVEAPLPFKPTQYDYKIKQNWQPPVDKTQTYLSEYRQKEKNKQKTINESLKISQQLHESEASAKILKLKDKLPEGQSLEIDTLKRQVLLQEEDFDEAKGMTVFNTIKTFELQEFIDLQEQDICRYEMYHMHQVIDTEQLAIEARKRLLQLRGQLKDLKLLKN